MNDDDPAADQSPAGSQASASQPPAPQTPAPQTSAPQTPAPQTSAPQTPADEPPFGLIDIVESFTALRHEARTQARENRELAQTLQQTTAQIETLERRLLTATDRVQQAVEQTSSDEEVRRLAETIADIEHHVSRANEAVQRLQRAPESSVPPVDLSDLQQQVQQRHAQLGPLTRWFAKSFLQEVQDAVANYSSPPVPHAAADEDPIQQGLEMLVQRIRRLMAQQHIKRIDTEGLPFDGQQMQAIDSVESSAHASGHVVQQLQPAYTFRGTLIKFAEVRVAK